MKRYADSIARQKRIRPPAGYETSGAICREFLEQHASRKAGGTTAETARPVKPATGYTERPASKRRRNAATRTVIPAQKKAPQRTTARKRNQHGMPLGTHADRLPNVGGNTPLKIPYGNKEVAQQLGTRYSADGWYAPPGVDLSAFREKGWL